MAIIRIEHEGKLYYPDILNFYLDKENDEIYDKLPKEKNANEFGHDLCRKIAHSFGYTERQC